MEGKIPLLWAHQRGVKGHVLHGCGNPRTSEEHVRLSMRMSTLQGGWFPAHIHQQDGGTSSPPVFTRAQPRDTFLSPVRMSWEQMGRIPAPLLINSGWGALFPYLWHSSTGWRDKVPFLAHTFVMVATVDVHIRTRILSVIHYGGGSGMCQALADSKQWVLSLSTIGRGGGGGTPSITVFGHRIQVT